MTEIPALLPGTLDMLILRRLQADTLHGYAIAQRLKFVNPRRAAGGRRTSSPSVSLTGLIATYGERNAKHDIVRRK